MMTPHIKYLPPLDTPGAVAQSVYAYERIYNTPIHLARLAAWHAAQQARIHQAHRVAAGDDFLR